MVKQTGREGVVERVHLIPPGLAAHRAALLLSDGERSCRDVTLTEPLTNPQKVSSRPRCPGSSLCQSTVLGRRVKVMDGYVGILEFPT